MAADQAGELVKARLAEAVGSPETMVTSDTALAMRLNGQSAASLLPLTQSGVGALLEGFVVSELTAQLSWSREMYSLFHFRNRSGKEVDIVAVG